MLGLAPRKGSNKNLPPDVILKLTNNFQTGRGEGYGEYKMQGQGTGVSLRGTRPQGSLHPGAENGHGDGDVPELALQSLSNLFR